MRLNSSKAVTSVASSDFARAIDVRCFAPTTPPIAIPIRIERTVIVARSSIRVKAARGRMQERTRGGEGCYAVEHRTSNIERRTLNVEVQPGGRPIHGLRGLDFKVRCSK